MKHPRTRRALPALPALLAGALALGACSHSATPSSPQPDPGPFTPPEATATGHTTPVTSADVHDRKVASVDELLVGRFPGVVVTRLPGGGLSVRIRGTNSVNSGNEPLYVIDGSPTRVDPQTGINWLGVNDIQRIEVLKDPAQTSFYGVQGANGVVLITTKH
jgi:TonB-dependent SusC/RagA subfamily outer membrane receptor